MRVIPVLDLKGGRAVHAVAGNRAHYAPVRTHLHPGSAPIGLALAYRRTLGSRSLYLADLDAIAGIAPPALPLYRELAELGLNLWVDPGLRDGSTARAILEAGAAGLVVGLETLDGPEVLPDLLAQAGPGRLVFSLDLRAGRPILAGGSQWGTDDPAELAHRAVAAGVSRVLLLDLARVGTGGGLGTQALAESLLASRPTAELWLGGGVSGVDDLREAQRMGVAAVLVGSALHNGEIGRATLREVVGDDHDEVEAGP